MIENLRGPIPFGTRVQVHRVVEAWYFTDPFGEQRWNKRGVWEQWREPHGLPVEPEPALPTSGTHRRLRRVERACEGVVVGRTWRAEGRYFKGGGYGEDWDPSIFEESRRVEVLQVAVDPGDVGGRFYAAQVVDVLPCDLSLPEVSS